MRPPLAATTLRSFQAGQKTLQFMNLTPSQNLSKAMPKISVIVPCRNEASHIAACVEGLLAMQAPAGGFEVVVADGISTDGTKQILEQMANRYPQLKVIDNPGRTTPCGLNAAIRIARGEIIVRADAHTTYAPDYLMECLETLQQKGADNVGGPARTKAEGYRQRAVAAAYHSPFSVGGARFHNIEFDGYVDTVTYGCWPRSAFEKFGLFDEELVRNQDDEHNLRIIRGGGKVYQSSKIKSWYVPRGSFAALFKQYMQYGYWKVRVIQKHKLPASWRHLVPGAFVLALGVSSLLSVFCFLLSEFSDLFSAPCHLSFDLLIGLVALYGFAVSMASIVTATKTEWKLLPALPVAFSCYHFGYGCGFLRGIGDFVLLRRRASTVFAELTRTSFKTETTGRADR